MRLATAVPSPLAGREEVVVWEVNTGKELSHLAGHLGTISGLAFNPDGMRVASAAWDGRREPEVKIWESTGGRELLSLKAPVGLGMGNLEFTADGHRLLGLRSARSTPYYDVNEIWDATPRPEGKSVDADGQ